MAADSNNIGRAIEEWVGELDGEVDRGVLGDWLTIACYVSVDSKGNPTAQYYIAMRDGNLLPHVAEGLLVRAEAELDGLRSEAE